MDALRVFILRKVVPFRIVALRGRKVNFINVKESWR